MTKIGSIGGEIWQIGRGGQLSKCSGDVFFWCKSCLINITRWSTKFGVNWTTPVVLAEIQFKFWHWVPTLQPGHHAPSRASFHPKTRQENFLYHYASAWLLKSRFGEGWFSTFLAPLLLTFSKGNGPKWSIWQTTGPFHSIFVAMIIIYQKSTIGAKTFRIGAVGGEM